jgi:hypothetical protein
MARVEDEFSTSQYGVEFDLLAEAQEVSHNLVIACSSSLTMVYRSSIATVPVYTQHRRVSQMVSRGFLSKS